MLTQKTSRGILIGGELFGPGLDFPEPVKLYCNKNKLEILDSELDDLFDSIRNSISILDAREGFHIYNSYNEELVYVTIDIDEEKEGYFCVVNWITKDVSEDGAREFETSNCPLIIF